MIVVTGGAGFIGSNLVRGLNAQGFDEIVVVDDLSDASKHLNLQDCRFVDYIDKDQLVMLGLNITESSMLRKAFEQVRQLPEVRSTSITSGRFDLIVLVVVDGNRGLINFLTGSISTVKEIVSSESFVLLKTDNYWL